MLSVGSLPDHMVDSSEIIFGAYIDIHLLYMSIKYMAHACNLVGIFVSGACEVDVAVGCLLPYTSINVWCLCQYLMREVLAIFVQVYGNNITCSCKVFVQFCWSHG